jgi:hypothetical protein
LIYTRRLLDSELITFPFKAAILDSESSADLNLLYSIKTKGDSGKKQIKRRDATYRR